MNVSSHPHISLFCDLSSKPPEFSDLHFVKGLLPHIEGFSQQEKIKFQKGVLDLLTNIYDKRYSDHRVPVFCLMTVVDLSPSAVILSEGHNFPLDTTKSLSWWWLLLIQCTVFLTWSTYMGKYILYNQTHIVPNLFYKINININKNVCFWTLA
jgi:hypothetical protein